MNLRDHFSEKEIKNLNGLEKRLKIGKWVFAFTSIMLVSISFMMFYGVYIFLEIKEAGFKDVFSFLINGEVEEDLSFLIFIGAFGVVPLIFLIDSFSGYIFARKQDIKLVRCWNLLSSLSEDNQDFGKSLK